MEKIKSLDNLLKQYQPTIKLPYPKQDFLLAVKSKIHRERIQSRQVKFIPRLIPILAPIVSLLIIVIGLVYFHNIKKPTEQPADVAQLELSSVEINPDFVYKNSDVVIQDEVLNKIVDNISLKDLEDLESEILSNVESDYLLDILSDEEKEIFNANLQELYQQNLLINNDVKSQEIGG
ncbi:MAG: hypothetical protein N2748_03155 [candidate division WOR-3 bacterium]|nr:hypothetical protein [candidate division WOR-3 bacterium]